MASGQAQVFQLDNGVWTQLGTDINGQSGGEKLGQSIAISGDGNTVAVGAPYYDGNGNDIGIVRLYTFVSGNWTPKGTAITGNTDHCRSATSISISEDGNTVAIGSPYAPLGGSVNVYQFQNNTWSPIGNEISAQSDLDSFGWSVSLNNAGTKLAVGAPLSDANGTDAGSVMVFELTNGTWSQIGSTLVGNAIDDQAGYSVSLSASGSTVAFGAPRNDDAGNSAGHVNVFKWDNSSWAQQGNSILGEQTGDFSGRSISLSHNGKIIAIGTPFNDANGTNCGHARIFQFAGGAWTQAGSDIDGQTTLDRLGHSVSLNGAGTTIVTGVPSFYLNGSSIGQAKVYSFPNIVGLESNSLAFSLYPNPVIHELYLNTDTQSITRLEIIDLSGKLILQHEGAIERINVQGLAKGLYTLRLYTDQGPINQQFVKL